MRKLTDLQRREHSVPTNTGTGFPPNPLASAKKAVKDYREHLTSCKETNGPGPFQADWKRATRLFALTRPDLMDIVALYTRHG